MDWRGFSDEDESSHNVIRSALRMNFSDNLSQKLINFQDINQLSGILVKI